MDAKRLVAAVVTGILVFSGLPVFAEDGKELSPLLYIDFESDPADKTVDCVDAKGAVVTRGILKRVRNVGRNWESSDRVKGKDGYAYSFGKGRYIRINLPEGARIRNDDFAVALWLKVEKPGVFIVSTTRVPYWLGTLLPKIKDDITAGFYVKFLLGAGAPTSVLQPTEVIDSQWHHVVINVDRGGEAKFYIDGDELDRSINISAHKEPVKDCIWIGDVYGGKGFEGLMDSCYLFKGTLSDEDIQKLYKK